MRRGREFHGPQTLMLSEFVLLTRPLGGRLGWRVGLGGRRPVFLRNSHLFQNCRRVARRRRLRPSRRRNASPPRRLPRPARSIRQASGSREWVALAKEITMGHSVFYHQGCPVCGRTLQIQVKLLGRRVYCQHCGGGFLATDGASVSPLGESVDRPLDAVVDDLLERAARLIERAAASSHMSETTMHVGDHR